MKRVVRSLIFSAFLSATVITVGAQTVPQSSQYFFNRLVMNPAFAGSTQYLNVVAAYRNQYGQLTDRMISNQNLSVDLPIYRLSAGVGLNIQAHFTGAQQVIIGNAALAYQINFKNSRLGFGISPGLIQSSLDGTLLRAPDGNYDPDLGSIDHNDPNIPLTKESGMTFDLGFGISFVSEKVFIGVSGQHILNPSIDLAHQNGTTQLNFSRTFSAVAGYGIGIGDAVVVQPSVMAMTDLTEMQLNFNALVFFKDLLWGGVGYKGFSKNSNDAVTCVFGFSFAKNFTASYSYDIGTSSLNNFNKGSHELLLGYRFRIEEPKKPGRIIYNPRFL